MTQDTWIGVAVFGFAILFWLGADGIRISPLDGPVGAAGLPKSLAYALAALAVLLIVRSIAIRKMAAPASRPAPTLEPINAEAAEGGWRAHVRAAGMLALGIGYLIVLPYLGYALAIVVLLLAAALYAGARIGTVALAFAILGGAFFYLLFVQFLNIPLPPGIWPALF